MRYVNKKHLELRPLHRLAINNFLIDLRLFKAESYTKNERMNEREVI